MPNNSRRDALPIVGGLLVALATVVVAAPSALAQQGYPDVSQYNAPSSLAKYRTTDRDGLWFSTGVGLICAIGDDGSYGCSDKVPGAPAGSNEVGWFPGDSFPRLYHTDRPTFDSGAEQTLINGRIAVKYHGSTCAVTEDQGVYCINGNNRNSQILVTAEMTFRGPNAQPVS